MTKRNEVLEAIQHQGMLPLFYHAQAQESVAIVQDLYASGIRVFEFTNRGEEALDVFKALIAARNKNMPGLYLGIGTIKTEQQARDFINVGADFIVAPTVNTQVGELAHQAGLLWVPGCMTPTEIALAQQAGAGLIKLFPANILGPGFLTAIRELFKGQLFMPTGGVDLEIENLSAWFKAGVFAVGMGSKLINPKDTNGLTERTKEALDLVQQARS